MDGEYLFCLQEYRCCFASNMIHKYLVLTSNNTKKCIFVRSQKANNHRSSYARLLLSYSVSSLEFNICCVFHLVAELWRAKRACGAPWVSKSTHPRKFGNHVTVHRPPARPLPVRPHHRDTNVYSHAF